MHEIYIFVMNEKKKKTSQVAVKRWKFLNTFTETVHESNIIKYAYVYIKFAWLQQNTFIKKKYCRQILMEKQRPA